MNSYSHFQQKFVLDVLRLLINIGVSVIVLFFLLKGSFSPWSSLFLSSLVAFTLSASQRMTWAWKILHAVLVPAVIIGLIISAEYDYFPLLFLICTLPLTLAYGPTVWTRVPFYRTTQNTVASLNSVIHNFKITQLLDVGSGNGRVLNLLSNSVASSVVLHGIELSPLLWVVSTIRSFLTPQTKYFLGSYWNHSFAPYDCIYVFLSPQPMVELWHKACWEMRPGTLVISHQFKIPDNKPLREINIPKSVTKLYVYKIPG